MQTGYITTYKTTINAPIEKVWDALTNPEIVKQYFFGSDQQTDWKVGSPIICSGEYEGQSYLDKGIPLVQISNQIVEDLRRLGSIQCCSCKNIY